MKAYLQDYELICIAHRGASGHEPENTLRSIEKALLLGAPWIEVDVYAVENELVVIHDPTLNRTTNGSGYVMDQTLEYIRSLDAGKGERIPLLREVFNHVSGRAGINVELKGPNTAHLVTSLIEEYVNHRKWTYDQSIVSSHDHQALQTVKLNQPKIRIGPLIRKIPKNLAQFAEDMRAYSVHVKMKVIKKPFVEDAHRKNLRVFVYTVNTASDIEKMKGMGVDGVFTNYPELITSQTHL